MNLEELLNKTKETVNGKLRTLLINNNEAET